MNFVEQNISVDNSVSEQVSPRDMNSRKRSRSKENANEGGIRKKTPSVNKVYSDSGDLEFGENEQKELFNRAKFRFELPS